MSRGQAKRKGLQPSGVATAGTVLGYLFTVCSVLVFVVLAAAVGAANDPTQQFIDCVNNAIANGTSSAGC